MNLNMFANEIKQKTTTAILAVIITAIGFVTTFLLLTLYTADRNTDRGLSEHQRLYRIESQFNLPNGDIVRSAQIPLPLVDALQKHVDIESVSYAFRLNAQLHHEGKVIPQVAVFAVTPEFMAQLHPYRDALPAPGPHDAYITADFNRQYLGLDSPIGKILDLGISGQFIIRAIVEPREDSSLNLAAIIAFTPERITGYEDKKQDWYDTHVYAFARLTSSQPYFDQQILPQIVSNNAQPLPGAPFTPSSFLSFSARNVLDMHYDEGYADEFAITRPKSLLYMLYTAALFVLFSTGVNFFNVNGILNASRRPSQQIKRSIGASNKQILSESLSVFLAQFLTTVVLALILLYVLTAFSPDISHLLDSQPVSHVIIAFSIAALFIALVMLASHLLSLSYSFFSPQKSNSPNRYQSRHIYYIKQIIMTVQLAVAGITLSLWAGVMTQNITLTEADFGYQKTHRITFPLDEAFYSLGQIRELEHRLQQAADVSAISLSNWQPFNMSRQIINVQHAQQSVNDQFTAMNTLSADKNFPDVWGLTSLAGQENRLQTSSDDGVCHAIVTREFMHVMGQNSFDEVLNTRYYLPYSERKQELRVLRIVENFYLGASLSSPQPLIVFITDRLDKFAALWYSAEKNRETVISMIKRYGPPGLSVETVNALHHRHFHHEREMLNIITLTAILALMLMVISTLVISLSEARRLSQTLKIMEAVGGSVATNMVFFLQQHVLPILFALLIVLVSGHLLLRLWLEQVESVTGQVYVNAFVAPFLLSLIVVAIMGLSLLLSSGRDAQFKVKRK